MSEQSNCLIVKIDQKDFNALEVLESHSTKIERLPKCMETVQYDIDTYDQAALGFKCHKVFVSQTELGTFVFAVIDYRNPNATAALTKNTLFTVEIKIKYLMKIKTKSGGTKSEWQKYKLTELYEHASLVDLIKCQLEDGSLASVGLLCIPIEPCWTISSQNPFPKLKQPLKVGVAIKSRYESNEEIKDPVHQNTDGNRPSDAQETEAWNPSTLTSGVWQFHKKGDQENYLLMCVAHGDCHPQTMTSATPIKVKLILRMIAKYSSHLVPPYHTSISIEPWYVKKENGFVHGLLAIPLPISTEKEARFFEVVTKDPGSLRLEIITLERES